MIKIRNVHTPTHEAAIPKPSHSIFSSKQRNKQRDQTRRPPPPLASRRSSLTIPSDPKYDPSAQVVPRVGP